MTRAQVRPPAVAGFFYPADAGELAAEVDRYLAGAPDHGLTPKAVIAPHAGYRYSAPVAASVYAGLRRLRGTVRRVVLLGPAHRVPVDGMAVPSADAFETPLGAVPLDTVGRAAVASLPHVVVDDAPHAPEHSLEVHLPFLQRVLGDFDLLPFAVGHAGTSEIADVIERCWGGAETLVVVSSDLSHYHDYETARLLDSATTRAIEELRVDALRQESACGVRPVAGMMVVARRRGMRVTTLDVRNSGDTQGVRDRVVGYGAWAFVDDTSEALADEHGRRLVELAHDAVRAGVEGSPTAGDAELEETHARLLRLQAAFVTLKLAGRLRGCVGGVEAAHPLARAVVRAATNAAFGDPRFPALSAGELPGVALSVSVLSPLERVLARSEDELLNVLRPGVDGLVLADGAARGVFLPQVWGDLSEPARFLARLREKAGLATDHWSPTLAVHRFTAESFS